MDAVDGNAIGGLLIDVFGTEMTAAKRKGADIPHQESISIGTPDEESMSMGTPDEESMCMGTDD